MFSFSDLVFTNLVIKLQGPVVRKPDSGFRITWLKFNIPKLRILCNNCLLKICSFIAFQAVLQRLKKSLSGGQRYPAFVQPAQK